MSFVRGEGWSAPSHHFSHSYVFLLPLLIILLQPLGFSSLFLFVRILFKVLLKFYSICKDLFVYFKNNLKIFTLHPWALGCAR